MTTTTAIRLASNDLPFSEWSAAVHDLFQNRADDYCEAQEIYSFSAAYDDGKTPSEAVADYDEFCAA